MKSANLCDLLQQSTSFTPETCQKTSVQILGLVQNHRVRPRFPTVLPAGLTSHSPQKFIQTLQSFFEPASGPTGNGLYGIINLTPESTESTVMPCVTEMIFGGVAIVQLRPKNCAENHILKIGYLLQQVLEQYQIPLIINDHPHLADRLGAYGVHLGQTDAAPKSVKERFPQLIIGQSNHGVEQAQQAQANTAVDWIALGPIFESPTKKGHAAVVGNASLQAAASLTQKPLIAIGGITTPLHAFKVGQSGAQYGAVISALAQPQQTRCNAFALGLGLWLGQHNKKETT